MHKVPWRRITSRVLVIALLFLVLLALGELLFVALMPLARLSDISQPVFRRIEYDSISSAQTTDYWKEAFENGPPAIARTIVVSATRTTVRIDLSLWLTRTHPCADRIISGWLEDAMPQFAEVAFGRVRVDGSPLSSTDFQSPVWIVDPTTQEMEIHLQAVRTTNAYPSGEIDRLETRSVRPLTDEFRLAMDGVRLMRLYPEPDSATPELVTFHAVTPTVLSHITFGTEPLPAADASGMDGEPNQAFLQRLGHLLEIPLLSSLLSSVARSLPLLLFLYLTVLQTRRPSRFVTSLAAATGALLIFHFVRDLLTGSSSLVYEWKWIGDLSAILERWLSTYSYSSISITPLLGHGAWCVVATVVGLLIPALLFQRFKAEDRRIRPTAGLAIRLASLILPLSGIVVALVFRRLESSVNSFGSVWTYMLLIGSISYLLIWGALEMVFRKLADQAPSALVAPLASLSIVVTIAWNTWTLGSETYDYAAVGWFVVTTLLGTFLILSFLALIRYLLDVALPGRAPKLNRGAEILVLASVLLLAIPMTALVDPTRPLAYASTISSLAKAIDGFIPLIWFAGIVWVLHTTGKKTVQLGAFPRTLGLLAASSLFFSPSSQWLFVPITFLLGWFVLARLLVRPVRDSVAIGSLVERVVEERSKLIDRILDLNAAEHAYRDYRKKQREHFVSGEISFEEYDQNIHDHLQQLQDMRQKSYVENRPARDVALAFGPRSTAWQNAIHGTKFALLFASPWIALALHNLLTQSTPNYAYPLWGLAYDITIVVLKWGLYGFFFGYFYPYLRGKNGLQKGLGLFLALVLPTLPLAAIFNSSASAWQATLFWVLQVFIQCSLLGLVAFDYVTLQRGGYHDWQLLFEVHYLPSVGVSVSSILLAIGAAVTTLLTTQATNLVGLALRFVIPQLPPDLPMP